MRDQIGLNRRQYVGEAGIAHERDHAVERNLAEMAAGVVGIEAAEIVLLVGQVERQEHDLAASLRGHRHGAAETDADPGKQRLRVGDEIEAFVDIQAEAEMERPLEGDRRMQIGRNVEGRDAEIEFDAGADRLGVAEHQVELDESAGAAEVIGDFYIVAGAAQAAVREKVRPADTLEQAEQLVLHEPDQPVEADIVAAQGGSERPQDLGAEIVNELRRRVVGERVADERYLDPEDFAADRILQLL